MRKLGASLTFRDDTRDVYSAACYHFRPLGCSVSQFRYASDAVLDTDRAGLDAVRRFIGAPENENLVVHWDISVWVWKPHCVPAEVIDEWAPLAPKLRRLSLRANSWIPSEYTAYVRAKTLVEAESLDLVFYYKSASDYDTFHKISKCVGALFAFTAGELTSGSLGRFLARDGDDAVKRTLKSFLLPTAD